MFWCLTPYQNQKLGRFDAVSWFEVSWFCSIRVESQAERRRATDFRDQLTSNQLTPHPNLCSDLLRYEPRSELLQRNNQPVRKSAPDRDDGAQG